MSELKKLLQGVKVEWKDLGDVGNVKMCKRIFKNETHDKGDIPFYKIGTFGKKADAYISKELYELYKSKYPYPNIGEVLISASGTIGRTVIYNGEPAYFQDSNIIWLENDESIVSNAYLWHFYKIAKWYVSDGGIIKRLYNDNVRKTKILIPHPNDPKKSLIIQREIVRILDSLFEETNKLTTALQNELDNHQKRYEYHREELFKFEGKEVEWKKISETGKFQRGKRFVRNDMISDGVPCIHYGEMYTHYGISAVESKSYLSKDLVLSKKLRVAEKGDVIIVAAGETIEDIGKGTAWLGEESVVTHDACFSYKSPIHPVYFAYFTRTNQYHDQIKRNISSGKISAINEKGFSSVLIPIPSIEEQDRIVKILDKLDATTQAITTEIKKEIELRNKHYEYYRDALLTFPKEVSKLAEPVTA